MGTLGVVPLAIASGAGSGARNAIGTGVICGVIAGTVLAVLCVPLFFVLVPRLLRARRPGEQGAARSEGLLAPWAAEPKQDRMHREARAGLREQAMGQRAPPPPNEPPAVLIGSAKRARVGGWNVSILIAQADQKQVHIA